MIEVSDEYYYEEEEDLNNNEEIEEEPDEGEVEEISSDNYHITEDKIVKRVDNKTVTTSVAGYVAGDCDSCGVDESDKEDITKVSQLENDMGYISDPNYVHTDNNYTSGDKEIVKNSERLLEQIINESIDKIALFYNLNIRKTYTSVAEMQSDVDNPIGLDGNPIPIGGIVSVVNAATPSESGLYIYTLNGFIYQSSWYPTMSSTISDNPNIAVSQKQYAENQTIYNTSHKDSSIQDLQQAIALVPEALKKEGFIITYKTSDGEWSSKQFISTLDQWNDYNQWNDFGSGGTQTVSGDIIISDEEPEDTDALWIDTSDKKFNNQNNNVISGLLTVISDLQQRLSTIEYAFSHEINFGDFANNQLQAFDGSETERPDPNSIPVGIGTYDDSEFDEPTEYNERNPNAKHLRVKCGTYSEMMANKDNFIQGEFLWCYDTKNLWIKNIGTDELIKIGSSNDEPNPEEPDVVDGILQEEINSIKRITGIEMVDMTNKNLLYRIEINNGKLDLYDYSLDENTLASNSQMLNTGKYYSTLYFPNNSTDVGSTTSPKVYINSVYCGGESATKTSYNPVSHNFVELCNLGKKDLNLKGLYLHYTCKNAGKWITLPLRGIIKSMNSFLIKGAQCSLLDVNTTYIQVGEPDMYWTESATLHSGELGDIYDEDGLIKFNESCSFFITGAESDTYYAENILQESTPWSTSGVIKWYVDLVGVGKYNGTNAICEKLPTLVSGTDYILYRYYNMDTVSQATKAVTARSNAVDWTYLDLNNMPVDLDVTMYTPKNSKQNKNIFFDKTLIESGAPNVVTCTFGYNAHTTRCFNWISKGFYNEYIWFRKDDEEYTDVNKFESFKEGDGRSSTKHWDDSIYNRIRTISTDGTSFTVHKFIKDFPEANQKYYYKVGREGFWTEERSFTLRTRASVISNGFKFLQVTDQQGFTGNEYDMWGECAKYIKNNETFDFVINTGDTCQNGNRINEYLDYYLDGDVLVKDYEHMFTVGNNDLCLLDPYALGDGEALSKVNPIYTEYFYTYEHPTEVPKTANGKYIASVYDFKYGDTYFLAMDSEITSTAKTSIYEDSNVYETIHTWCNARLTELASDSNIKWKISYCHDCPLTLLTADLIMLYLTKNADGSYTKNPSVKRGGSHLNTEGAYWYSQFLQDNGFKLCFGGHKHTYTNTRLIHDDPDLTMEPIVYSPTANPDWYVALPAREKNLVRISTDSSLSYVKYVTCQATGFKLISNKELPAQNIPWLSNYYPVSSQVEDADTNSVTVKVNIAQQFPHYIVWSIGKGTEVENPANSTTIRDRIMGKSYKLKKIGSNDNWWYYYYKPVVASQLEKVGGNGVTNSNYNIIVE